MHNKKKTIAIFDIGKTNKKIFLFDENYQIVWEKSTNFEETKDEDGNPCEDISLLKAWLIKTWEEISSLNDFEVPALNFSTYGASLVHLDETGKPLTPLYNYLKPYPLDLQQQFYAKYGGEVVFSRKTASPVLGSLNAGMILYRLKYEKLAIFDAIKYSLHLPQYISFLFSNTYFSDITSIGCHTNLWDFDEKTYHKWVYTEGIAQKLAPINTKPISLEYLKEQRKTIIGVGLHDSSAALIPYLMRFQTPFILLSTGTWNIALNPFNEEPLTNEELEADCLSYLAYDGKPVKASRLFAGYEHEQTTKHLAEKWNLPLNYYKTISFIPNLEFQIATKYNTPLLSKKQINDNSLLQSDISYEIDYHYFIKNLVKKQVEAIKLILSKKIKNKETSIQNLYVDGGFSKNEIFMRLLAAAFPNLKIYAAEVAQASALGAALVLHNYWNSKDLPPHLISIKKYDNK